MDHGAGITMMDHHGGSSNMDSSSMMDEDAFCQGMGRVMMPGFQWSFSPSDSIKGNSCILWLFQGALVDTQTKYVGAVFGTFFLAFAFEMIRTARVRFSKGEAPFEYFREGGTAPTLLIDGINAISYMVQVTIAYWLMLLVMLYEAMLFIAIVSGLGTGYFIILRMKRSAKNSSGNPNAGSRDDDTDAEVEVPPAASIDVEKERAKAEANVVGGTDETHEAQTPCCANA